MGVYIKDWNKPERCVECILFKSCADGTLSRGKGIIFGENDKEWFMLKTIPNWCPLIEIDIPMTEEVTEGGNF